MARRRVHYYNDNDTETAREMTVGSERGETRDGTAHATGMATVDSWGTLCRRACQAPTG